MISSKSFHVLLVHYYKTENCKYSSLCWNYLHHAVMSTTCTSYFYSLVEALTYYAFSFYFIVLFECCIFVNTLLSFIWFVSLFSQNLISGIPRIGQGQRKSLHIQELVSSWTPLMLQMVPWQGYLTPQFWFECFFLNLFKFWFSI